RCREAASLLAGSARALPQERTRAPLLRRSVRRAIHGDARVGSREAPARGDGLGAPPLLRDGVTAMRLDGKTALITGAGSGMGRLAAQLFAKEGAQVAAADLNKEALAGTVSIVQGEGG